MQYYISKDKLQYFTYGGISSADFGIVIAKTNQLSSPERSIEVIEVDGRNEPLIMDKGNYKPFKLELECYIDAENDNIHEVARSIKRWLQAEFKFKQLRFSDDLEYAYEAVCINKLDIEEVINLLGEFKLNFLCKPLKRQITDSSIVITNNCHIHNEGLPSRPYIKVTGDGDITINIKQSKYNIKRCRRIYRSRLGIV